MNTVPDIESQRLHGFTQDPLPDTKMDSNDFFTVGSMCWGTLPCFHNVTFNNGEVRHMRGDNIYKLYIDNNNEVHTHFKDYESHYKRNLNADLIKGGDLELIKKQYISGDYNSVDLAVVNDRLDIVKYLVEELNQDVYHKSLVAACKIGDLSMFKYLESKNVKRGTVYVDAKTILEESINAKNLELVKYLTEKKEESLTSRALLMILPDDTKETIRLREYVIDKCIEQKLKIEGDASIYLASYPEVFDLFLKENLVSRVKTQVVVNIDNEDVLENITHETYVFRDLTDETDDMKFVISELHKRASKNISTELHKFSVNKQPYIELPRFYYDINSLSISFTGAEDVKKVFLDVDGTVLLFNLVSKNTFKLDISNVFHTYCLVYSCILLIIDSAGKDFDSINLNIGLCIKYQKECPSHSFVYKMSDKYAIQVGCGWMKLTNE